MVKLYFNFNCIVSKVDISVILIFKRLYWEIEIVAHHSDHKEFKTSETRNVVIPRISLTRKEN